jgi:hypothetical protein
VGREVFADRIGFEFQRRRVNHRPDMPGEGATGPAAPCIGTDARLAVGEHVVADARALLQDLFGVACEIDVDALVGLVLGIEDRYWRNTDNKTDQRIDIYLAGHAKAIIDDCPRIGDYVFTRSGEIGLRSDTWSGKTSGALARHIWPAIHEAAAKLGIDPIREHFTAHDLRRTVRTGLTGWAGVLPDTAERVLNHSISGLRAHYDFADYRPHVAEALQRWDAELGRILKGEREAVTPIKKTTAS